jgi:hypothetical protein
MRLTTDASALRRSLFRCNAGDVTALTDAVGTLRADPALAQRLAEQVLADARMEFSVG